MSSLFINDWDSGSYLFLITSVSAFACSFPLFLDFHDIGTIKNENPRAAILEAMNSKQCQFSLVANVAVGIPVAIDYVMEFFYGMLSKSNQTNQARLPRIILIYSLVGPNLLILLVSIPLRFVELTICIFLTRLIFLFYGVLGHLWIVGGDMFRSYWCIISQLALSLGILTVTYDTISADQVTYLFWLATSFYAVSIISAAVIGIKFLLQMRKIGFRCIGILGVYFYISGLIHRGQYDKDFFVPYTYVAAAFTLMLTVLQSFLTRYEKLLIKDVSALYYYIFLHSY